MAAEVQKGGHPSDTGHLTTLVDTVVFVASLQREEGKKLRLLVTSVTNFYYAQYLLRHETVLSTVGLDTWRTNLTCSL